MYAVVEISGSQFKVSEGDRVRVPKLTAEAGDKVTFDRVLLVSEEGGTKIGTPRLENATVEASVLKHGKDEKVRIFKMKRRKGYRRTNGHRQPFTDLQIGAIAVAG